MFDSPINLVTSLEDMHASDALAAVLVNYWPPAGYTFLGSTPLGLRVVAVQMLRD